MALQCLPLILMLQKHEPDKPDICDDVLFNMYYINNFIYYIVTLFGPIWSIVYRPNSQRSDQAQEFFLSISGQTREVRQNFYFSKGDIIHSDFQTSQVSFKITFDWKQTLQADCWTGD